MSARLPRMLRRREAERRRVEAFVAAIRATAPATPARATIPVPRVQLIDTPRGPVWALDEATRNRLRSAQEPDTLVLPMSVVTMVVRP